MDERVVFSIDGKECAGRRGQTIAQAAREGGIFIPVLCDYEGLPPSGACRVCTVKVNGRPMAACTTAVGPGMEVENDTPELRDLRKTIIEMLFVEGNHFCPSCEKSGNCELQALAYQYQVMAPRFPFLFAHRTVDASNPKLVMERNRCILCKRCVRAIVDGDGRHLFGFYGRGGDTLEVAIDGHAGPRLTDEQAQQAMDVCPVGALIRKGKGFDVPIGNRRFDTVPIGSQSAAVGNRGGSNG